MRYFVFDKQGNLKGAERIRGEWALVYTKSVWGNELYGCLFTRRFC